MSTHELLMDDEIDAESGKKQRFNMRVTAEQKELLEKAARASGQSLTSFALSVLLERARGVIQDEAVTQLSMRDWNKVKTLIDNPPTPNAALKQAMADYQLHVRSDV